MKQQQKSLISFFCTLIFLSHISLATADTASDTDTLLNWAENNYPAYFPSHQTTQSIAPWLFRFYPETNIYAGVNTNDKSVYVFGGPWGNVNPTYIDSLSKLIAIAQGGKLTNVASIVGSRGGFNDATNFIIRGDGTVWGWGTNIYGSIGDGTTEMRNIPVQVSVLKNIVEIKIIRLSLSQVSLALKNDGTIWTWGWNLNGDIGNGTGGKDQFQLFPVKVSDIGDIVKIGVHSSGFYAIKKDGTLWVWGCTANQIIDNSFSLCPSMVAPYSPVQVDLISDVKEFHVYLNNYFAIKHDGTVWVWGSNIGGILGVGTTTAHKTPIQINALKNVKSLHFGNFSSISIYALQDNGEVWAWGNTDYQLGINEVPSRTDIIHPTQLKMLSDITKISVSHQHKLALKSDGTVWVWGTFNLNGELGNGLKMDSAAPKPLSEIIEPIPIQLPISDAIDVETEINFGTASSFALKRDGTLIKWGIGSNKDGSLTEALVPTHVCVIPGSKMIHSSSNVGAPYLLNNNGTVWIGYSDGCVQF